MNKKIPLQPAVRSLKHRRPWVLSGCSGQWTQHTVLCVTSSAEGTVQSYKDCSRLCWTAGLLRGSLGWQLCFMTAWGQDLTYSCQEKEMPRVCVCVCCRRRSDEQVKAEWAEITSGLKYYHMLLALYHCSLGWWLAGVTWQPCGKSVRDEESERKRVK